MEILTIIILLIALLLALTGVIGAVAPALPGPPLSFASLLIAYFACPGCISTQLLLWMCVLTIATTAFDYIAPMWLTKLGGGSKKAVWGSTIGLFIGLFFMPLGLIIGPLVGAFVGEIMNEASLGKASRVALMSFVAFLVTTGAKLVASAIMLFYTMEAMWNYFGLLMSDFSWRSLIPWL